MTKDKVIKGSNLEATCFIKSYKVQLENENYYIVVKLVFSDGTNTQEVDLTRSLSSKQKGFIMQVMKDYE